MTEKETVKLDNPRHVALYTVIKEFQQPQPKAKIAKKTEDHLEKIDRKSDIGRKFSEETLKSDLTDMDNEYNILKRREVGDDKKSHYMKTNPDVNVKIVDDCKHIEKKILEILHNEKKVYRGEWKEIADDMLDQKMKELGMGEKVSKERLKKAGMNTERREKVILKDEIDRRIPDLVTNIRGKCLDEGLDAPDKDVLKDYLEYKIGEEELVMEESPY